MFAKVNGKDVLGEPMFHNINGFVIKVWVILLGGCLTVKNQWGVYSQEVMGLTLPRVLVFEEVVA